MIRQCVRSVSGGLWLSVAGVAGLALAGSCDLRAEEPSGSSGPLWVYVGTYTQGESQGIYRMLFDPVGGTLSAPELAAEAVNPSFLTIRPDRRFLYSVGEIGDFQGKSSGSVSAFGLDPATGALTPLNSQPSEGSGPCYVAIDRDGKNVLVANYGSGSVAVLPVGPDGRLGPATDSEQHAGSSVDPRRQKGPHAHSINLDAANRFAVAADLGLDKLLVYHFDGEAGTLTPNDPPFAPVEPGSGPRHLAFHPDGRHAYVINEMASTITALDYAPERGVLKPIQTISTLPEGFDGESYTAEVQVHPSGRFVYGSNRGHDSIAVFAVDPDNGRLTPVETTVHRGQDPAQLRHRPDRPLAAGRQPGIEQHRGLPHRRRERPARTDRPGRPCGRAGLRQVRGEGALSDVVGAEAGRQSGDC